MSISQLGFAGLYNFLQDDEELAKFPMFVEQMQTLGASFERFSPDADSLDPAFTSDGLEWVGRLSLSNEVLLAAVDSYVSNIASQLEVAASTSDFGDLESIRAASDPGEKYGELLAWLAQLQEWVATAHDHPEIRVTIDLPNPAALSCVTIAYWVDKPAKDIGEFDGDAIAELLIRDVYLHIDNLFSAFVFDLGGFTYAENELRKLAFVSLLGRQGGATESPYDVDQIRPLIHRGLITESRDECFLASLNESDRLVYSKGFQGMTGQPDVFKVPTLGIIIVDTAVHTDGISRCPSQLMRLGSVLKSVSHLNAQSDVHLPLLLELTREDNPRLEAWDELEEIGISGNDQWLPDDLVSVIRRGSFLSAHEDLRREPRPAISEAFSLPEYVVDPEVSGSLGAALCSIDCSPYDNFELFRHTAQSMFKSHMPLEFFDFIRSGKFENSARGTFIFRGLPVDPGLTETPTDGKRSASKQTFVSEACILAVGSELGEPFSFAEEKGGEIIHNVCPIKGQEDSKSNAGSKSNFGLHTEVAFHPLRPHFLLLCCLRSDHDNESLTYVVDVIDAYRRLSLKDRSELRQANFVLQAPESFRRGLQGDGTVQGPAVEPSGNSLYACLNYNTMKALTKNAQRALDALRDALHSPGVVGEVQLQPGELVAINNQKAVHGRNGFKPRFDGNDRWLQRIYVRNEIWTQGGAKFPARVIQSN